MQHDFLPIKKDKITLIAGGGIRVKGIMASSGWMDYLIDGKVQKQFVPFETLTDIEHITALKGMPLTLHHPSVEINPNTYKDYTVGSVLDVFPNAQIQALECEIAINEGEAIASVTNGKITDLSCGYEVEKQLIGDNQYKQIKRVPNHLSLVPEGRDKKATLLLDGRQVIKPKIKLVAVW